MIADAFLPTALVSVRLLPLFVAAPIASLRRAPMFIRITLSVLLGIVIGTSINLENIPEPLDKQRLLILFLSEFTIGASLAFSIHAASASLHTMGQLIDTQIGFAAATIFDPGTQQVATPTAELLTLGLVVTFLQFNVHHDLLLGFAKLLQVIPPGTLPNWSSDWLKVLGTLYGISFIITAPVILSLWFADFFLAFLSRSLPQAPIYFVGLPVKVGLGILVLAWFFSNALEPLLRLLSNALLSWNLMFKV